MKQRSKTRKKKRNADWKRKYEIRDCDHESPNFTVTVKGDDRGFWKTGVLRTKGSSWNTHMQDQRVVTIKYLDGNIVLILRRPKMDGTVEELTLETDICEMGDIRTLLEVMHRDTKISRANSKGWYGTTYVKKKSEVNNAAIKKTTRLAKA